MVPKGFIPRAGARKSRFEADSREELKTTNPTPAQRQRALALPKDGGDAAAAAKKKEPTQVCNSLHWLEFGMKMARASLC